MKLSDTAEGASAEGTPAQTETTDLGQTSTESVASDQAVGAESEPELYTVKVGGKEERIPLDEALSGYMRQADYTRKSQEVAQQRQELAQVLQLKDALERDFQGTVRKLAAVAGVDYGTAERAATQVVGDDETDPLTGLQRQVQQLTQQLTAREQAEQQKAWEAAQQSNVKAQIESEIANLKAQHGEFPEMELIQYAVDHGLNNLDAAWRAWQYDALEQKRIAEANAAVEAKRRAQVVGGGQNVAPASLAQGAGNERVSVRDALMRALQTHNA